MSDEVRSLLRRGTESGTPAWGFELVWERSRRLRRRAWIARGVTVVASLALIAVIATSITWSGDPGQDERSIRTVSGGTWESIPPAPIEGRVRQVAVWTGEEMLVWGGQVADPANVNETLTAIDGAIFNLESRSWSEMSESPLEESDGRTAVWTGSEMIVWGGEKRGGGHQRPDSGAAYDPSSDSWRELSPSPYWSLASHSVVWTGEEMIAWGGVDMERHGVAYEPTSDSWRALPAAPVEGRFRHSAVWTGREMIVWGGSGIGGENLGDGAAYDPRTDTWRTLASSPLSGRDSPIAVWTGKAMVVWGGWDGNTDRPFKDGAAYYPDPGDDGWGLIPDAPVRSVFFGGSAAWADGRMVVSGDTGRMAAYSPSKNEWQLIPDPPGQRRWAIPMTGSTLLPISGGLLLWGGASQTESKEVRLLNDGAILHLDR